MTIAAGFWTSQGILLCADSQFTGSAKSNQPKIFGYPLHRSNRDHNCLIAFAVAGNAVNAKMAIEDCVEDIEECPPEKLTIKEAHSRFRANVKKIHEQYVDTRSDPVEKENARFALVIGCWLPMKRGLRLFRTDGPGVTSEDYCCVGTGAYLGFVNK